ELIAFFLRHVPLLDELGVPRHLFLRVRGRGTVASEGRQRLLVRVAVRSLIDLEQRLAARDLLSLLEENVRDDAVDLGRDRCRLDRRHDAVRIEGVWHRGSARRRYGSCYRWTLGPVLGLRTGGERRDGKIQNRARWARATAIGGH